jgi:hypothetical protein
MIKFLLLLFMVGLVNASEPIRKEKTRNEVRYTKAVNCLSGDRREYVVWRTRDNIYKGKCYLFSTQLKKEPPERWLPDAEQFFKQFEREYQAEHTK